MHPQLRIACTSGTIPMIRRRAEIAGVVEFLCNEGSAFITGANLAVNGGDFMGF